jgi:hypothetical protein
MMDIEFRARESAVSGQLGPALGIQRRAML